MVAPSRSNEARRPSSSILPTVSDNLAFSTGVRGLGAGFGRAFSDSTGFCTIRIRPIALKPVGVRERAYALGLIHVDAFFAVVPQAFARDTPDHGRELAPVLTPSRYKVLKTHLHGSGNVHAPLYQWLTE